MFMTPYKLFLVYFNKFYGELIKNSSKQFIRKTKIGHLNDKNVILKNYVDFFLQIYIKKGKNSEK